MTVAKMDESEFLAILMIGVFNHYLAAPSKIF